MNAVRTTTSAVLAALVLACYAAPLSAQLSPEHQTQLWHAQWITASAVPQKDEVVLHFRKVIEMSAPPQHFYVDVSADNQFIFHVNQHRVGTGPGRSDLAHWKYETYDIGPLLRPGKNVLASTVWH